MNDISSQMINVEVAYAEPQRQEIIALEVSQGTTAAQAVEISGIRDKFEALAGGIDLELGVFSKKCEPEYELQAGERVEIYRPLIIDPKEARRLKAEVAERRKAEEKQG